MVNFSHVYKAYSDSIQALKNIDLQIDKGEFVFITGPSGAGKTTLFRMLSGFDRPTSGHLNVAGFDLGKIKGSEIGIFRRKIGVVFQDFKLLKDRTVGENVALPLEIRGEGKRYIQEKVEKTLSEVGLIFKRDQYPDQLSGGEQQRVSIARALIHQPGLLIADEPTGNLDPDLSEEIMNLLDRVNAQGTTVFVATHDLQMVKRRAKRVVRIKDGSIIEDTGCGKEIGLV